MLEKNLMNVTNITKALLRMVTSYIVNYELFIQGPIMDKVSLQPL